MDELLAYREGLLSGLEHVIPEVSRIVADIPANAWQLSSERDGQTPHYTLTHLEVLESLVFNSNLQLIGDQSTPLLPMFDDIAWMANHYPTDKSAQGILEEFIFLRRQEIQWLRALPQSSWSLSARHPWWGVHTLQWWVELQLDHSLQHLSALTAFLTI
jgi:hypothetical protein